MTDLSDAALQKRATEVFGYCCAHCIAKFALEVRDAARAEQREVDAQIATSISTVRPHPRYNHLEDKNGDELIEEIVAAIRGRR